MVVVSGANKNLFIESVGLMAHRNTVSAPWCGTFIAEINLIESDSLLGIREMLIREMLARRGVLRCVAVCCGVCFRGALILGPSNNILYVNCAG